MRTRRVVVWLAAIVTLFSLPLFLAGCDWFSDDDDAKTPASLTTMLQGIPVTDPDLDEQFPGSANYWDLNSDLALSDGGDDQFDDALELSVDGVYFPVYDDENAMVYSELKWGGPTFDNVLFAAIDNTGQYLEGGTDNVAVLASTTGTTLKQTIDLTAAVAPVTLSFAYDVSTGGYYDFALPDQYCRVQILSTSGAVLDNVLNIGHSDGDSGTGTLDISAYAGRKVVLSIKYRADEGQYAAFDDISIVDNNAEQFVTNGDFEGGQAGWTLTVPASLSQNLTTGNRNFLEDNTVRVARSFYTVPGKLWGRWVDTFTNTSAAEVTINVTYDTNLGSDDAGIIYTTPDTGGMALTSWDGNGYDRDVALVYGNAESVDWTSATALNTYNGDDMVYTTYPLVIPAKSTKTIVNFIVLGTYDTGYNAESVEDMATEVDAAAAAIVADFETDPQYKKGMTATQLGTIANW